MTDILTEADYEVRLEANFAEDAAEVAQGVDRRIRRANIAAELRADLCALEELHRKRTGANSSKDFVAWAAKRFTKSASTIYRMLETSEQRNARLQTDREAKAAKRAETALSQNAEVSAKDATQVELAQSLIDELRAEIATLKAQLAERVTGNTPEVSAATNRGRGPKSQETRDKIAETMKSAHAAKRAKLANGHDAEAAIGVPATIQSAFNNLPSAKLQGQARTWVKSGFDFNVELDTTDPAMHAFWELAKAPSGERDAFADSLKEPA